MDRFEGYQTLVFEYIQKKKKKNHLPKNLSSYTSLLGVLPTVDSIFSFNLNFTIDLRHRQFRTNGNNSSPNHSYFPNCY